MFKLVITAAAIIFVGSTLAVSAGGIGLGIGGIGIVIGPGSVAPPREYHPRVRSYHEEPSRPRHQQRQHDDDDKAEAAAPAKSQANENSSIAVLTGGPEERSLRPENSSIALSPQPVEPAQSAAVANLENSSIASAARTAESARSATVAVQAESPVHEAVSSQPVLCSRYFPTAGRTMQVPCE